MQRFNDMLVACPSLIKRSSGNKRLKPIQNISEKKGMGFMFHEVEDDREM
jgi:hypothetical protein